MNAPGGGCCPELLDKGARAGRAYPNLYKADSVPSHGIVMLKIPVNYTKRVGHSSVTGNKWVAFKLGLRMIWMILGYRLRSWAAPHYYPRLRH